MRNRIALVVSAILVLGLMVGLTTSASAGAGGSGDTGAKKKKKKKVCPAGTHKVTVKKKNGKKKKKCVADAPVTTPAGPTTLSINPASFDFGTVPHGGFTACEPDPDPECPTHAFTVTNSGGAASGVPAASITIVSNPVNTDPPAYQVSASSCTAALAPGATCTVTVKFAPNSNPTDPYVSALHVVATPGSDAQATLSGHGGG
jgi:hypothetical protein